MISPLAADFIPGYPGHTSGANGQVTRVVIHATVSACVRGGARNNAAYFQQAGSGGLAHYIVDPGEIIATCDEVTSCWHAPPNHGSIGVELTDWQDGDHWADPDHQAMLDLAGQLVADICARHNLPVVWLSVSNLLAGDCGITSHANVAQAWHKTDHTDPGPAFPVDAFLALVQGGAPQPAPQPIPTHEEIDVVIYQRGDDPNAQSFLLAGGKLCFQDAHEVLLLASKGVPVVDHCSDKTWNNLVKTYGNPVTV